MKKTLLVWGICSSILVLSASVIRGNPAALSVRLDGPTTIAYDTSYGYSVSVTNGTSPYTVDITLTVGLFYDSYPGTCQGIDATHIRCVVTTSFSFFLQAPSASQQTQATIFVLVTDTMGQQATLNQPLTLGVTPTATMIPTNTLQPTPTATAVGPTVPAATATPWIVTATPTTSPETTTPQPDAYEPNNTLDTAAPIGIGAIDKLSFFPVGDRDYYRLVIKPSQAGLSLTIQTYIDYGLDTYVRVFDDQGTLIAENDDVSATELRSRIDMKSQAGTYRIEVQNTADTRAEFKLYRLDIQLTAMPVGSQPVAPTPTAAPSQGDAWENNYDFTHAARIAVGDTITPLTFGCPFPEPLGCGDNDFFKFAVKGGYCYVAETIDLSPGIDTNVIIYGAEGDMAAPWAGNDDADGTTFQSRVQFCTSPTLAATEAFALIGNVGNIPPPDPIADRRYSFRLMLATPTESITATPLATATPTDEPTQQPTFIPPTLVPAGTAQPAPVEPTPATDNREVVREAAPTGWAKVKVSESMLWSAAPPTEKDAIALYTVDDQVQLVGQAYAGWVKVVPVGSVTPGWMWAADLMFLDTADGTPVPQIIATQSVTGTMTKQTAVPQSAQRTPTTQTGDHRPPVLQGTTTRRGASPPPPASTLEARTVNVRVCTLKIGTSNTCGITQERVRVDLVLPATGQLLGTARTDRNGVTTFSVNIAQGSLLQVLLPTLGIVSNVPSDPTVELTIVLPANTAQ